MARNLLVYFVIDNSGSMNLTDTNGIKRIDGALSVLDGLKRAIEDSSLASLKTLIKPAVISFNQVPTLVFPNDPNNIKDNRHMRKFTENLIDIKKTIKNNCTNNQTFYTALFNYLGQLIKEDQKAMIRDNVDYYRPLICFITDGKPEGNTETNEAIMCSFDTLFTTNLGHENENEVKSPVIYCVGIGNGEENEYKNLKKYGAGRLATDGDKKIISNYRKNNGDLVKIVQRNYTQEFNYLSDNIVNSIILSFSPTTNDSQNNRNEWDIAETFDSTISPMTPNQSVL